MVRYIILGYSWRLYIPGGCVYSVVTVRYHPWGIVAIYTTPDINAGYIFQGLLCVVTVSVVLGDILGIAVSDPLKRYKNYSCATAEHGERHGQSIYIAQSGFNSPVLSLYFSALSFLVSRYLWALFPFSLRSLFLRKIPPPV